MLKLQTLYNNVQIYHIYRKNKHKQITNNNVKDLIPYVNNILLCYRKVIQLNPEITNVQHTGQLTLFLPPK